MSISNPKLPNPSPPWRAPARLADLGFPAQFLVWAARQWIHLADPDEPAAHRLGDAFERIGAPRALVSLDAVLGALASGARRRLDFRALGDTTLGEDEHALVEVIDSLQAQPADRATCACVGMARAIVADWVGPAGLSPLQARLADLAMQLGAAGLRVSCLRSAAVTARGPHAAPRPLASQPARLH
jgi:hypothetical protein